MELSLTSIVQTAARPLELVANGIQNGVKNVLIATLEHYAAQGLNQNLQKARSLADKYAIAMNTTISETEPDTIDVSINGEECTAYIARFDNGMKFAVPISNKTGRILYIDERNLSHIKNRHNGPVEIDGLTIRKLDPSLSFIEYVSISEIDLQELNSAKDTREVNVTTISYAHDRIYKVTLKAEKAHVGKELRYLSGNDEIRHTRIKSTSNILTNNYDPRDDSTSRRLSATLIDKKASWTVGFDNEGYLGKMTLTEVNDWPTLPGHIRLHQEVYFNEEYTQQLEATGSPNDDVLERKAREAYVRVLKLRIDKQVGFDETQQQILNYGRPTLVAAGRSATHSRRKVIPLHRE